MLNLHTSRRCMTQFGSVQLLSHVQLLVTPWAAACQASLSITNSQGLLKLMSIESGMPSNHLILCHTFLLPPSIFPSIRVFSNESALRIRWSKYWSFSFNTTSAWPRLSIKETTDNAVKYSSVQFSSVQLLSRVRLFATPWIAARQASLSITNSRSSPKLMSIESVMPSSHLILCHPLLLLPPIPPSIRVFSNANTQAKAKENKTVPVRVTVF